MRSQWGSSPGRLAPQKESTPKLRRKFWLVLCLQTDHKPLLTLFNKNKPIPQQAANRIQRWALKLALYEYTIEWRASEAHVNTDTLSKLPLPQQHRTTIPAELLLMVERMEEAPVTAKQVATLTQRDPLRATVYYYIQEGWPTQNDDPVMKPYWTRRLRVAFPPSPPVQDVMLTKLHSGHPGCSRMKSLACGLLWWPRLDHDIETAVKQCENCQKCQPLPPTTPLQPWAWSMQSWSRLHIDFAGPMAGKMFLVIIYAHSKWIEVITNVRYHISDNHPATKIVVCAIRNSTHHCTGQWSTVHFIRIH